MLRADRAGEARAASLIATGSACRAIPQVSGAGAHIKALSRKRAHRASGQAGPCLAALAGMGRWFHGR